MKARVATIISVSGVLFAGTAAALVNTEVLGRDATSGVATVPATAPTSGSTPTTGSTPVTTPTSVTTPATGSTPTSTLTSTPTTTPTSTTTATTAPTPVTTPPVGAGQSTFQVGAAGTVTVTVRGDGGLALTAATPATGWIVERQEQKSATAVEVRFSSDEGEARFEASLVRGVVVTDVDLRDDADDSGSGAPSTTPSGSGSSGSGTGGSGSGSGSTGSSGSDDRSWDDDWGGSTGSGSSGPGSYGSSGGGYDDNGSGGHGSDD